MGYKTWFHKLQESENAESPYHGNAALMAGGGITGGGVEIKAVDPIKKDEPGKGNTTNNYLSDDPAKTEGEDTLEVQLAVLKENLEKETDEDKRKETMKQIEEISLKITEQNQEEKEV